MSGEQLSFEQIDIFDLADHFSQFVLTNKDNECYEWDGKYRGKVPFYPLLNKRAQVVAYELLNKKTLPPRTQVITTCQNPQCVNPYHLIQRAKSKKKKHRVPLGDQPNKRAVQREQNNRLSDYLDKKPELYGDIMILPGLKYVEATQPYLTLGIARNILLCEEVLDTYSVLKHELTQHAKTYPNLRLYPHKADILDVIPTLSGKGKWTGFDLDFSGAITGKRWPKLIRAIDSIIEHQDIWWLRVTVTTRPNTPEATRDSLNDLLKYLVCCDSFVVEDLATGPVYAYRDGKCHMQTMQVICKRR